MPDLNQFIITKKRKKYKFALFAHSPLCFELEQWQKIKLDGVEIGAGTGRFSVAQASHNLEQQFLAVDVKADRLQAGARAASEAGQKNIRFLRARAGQLDEAILPHSLREIWVTFPDPFPKKRSAKHRLLHPQYLGLYQRLLAREGALYFKTDARDLFDWSLEQLVAAGWILQELSLDLHTSNLPERYKITTTYEQRYMREGKPICFVKAALNS